MGLHFTEDGIFTIGMTFTGRPSIFIDFGGSVSLTNSVSKISLPYGPGLNYQPTTVPSWLLVIQSSVAILCLIIIGIPMQSDNFPGI